jgi:branched-chain amino acid transport system substrate-binding protein
MDRKRFSSLLLAVPGLTPRRLLAENRDFYKIGVTYPLTGPLASSGNEYLPAAQVAVAHINRAGGVNGHPLELVVEDTQGQPQGGIAAMRKVVQVDGALAVLTIYTNVVTAQMPLAEQIKVPLLSPVEAPGLMAKSAYAFSHAASVASMGGLWSNYWRKNKEKRVFAFIVSNAFGPFISAVAKGAAQNAGCEYLETPFNYGENDYRGLVARAKEFGPDAIIIAEQGGVDGTLIIKQVREAGIKAPIFFPGIFYDEVAWRNGVGPYIGGVFEAGIRIDPRAGKQFIDDYRIKTGHFPSYVSGEVYDQIKMFAAAIVRGGYTGEAIRNQLASMKGVPSVFGGQIVMDAEHYSIPSTDSLWTVRDGKLVRVAD